MNNLNYCLNTLASYAHFDVNFLFMNLRHFLLLKTNIKFVASFPIMTELLPGKGLTKNSLDVTESFLTLFLSMSYNCVSRSIYTEPETT